MWRLSARKFQSNAIKGFSNDFPLLKKVHPILQSYYNNNNTNAHFQDLIFIPQTSPVRLYSSSSTDSAVSHVIVNENDSFNIGEMWKIGIEEANDVFETHVSDSETKGFEAVVGNEVDGHDLDKVVSLLNGKFEVGNRSLESSLDDMNLDLSEEFVMKVLESEGIPGENLVGFFKWVTKDAEASGVSSKTLDALVRVVCGELKKKVSYSLWDLVKEIGEKQEKGVVTTEMLNSLISLFSRLGKGMAGYEVFNKFGDFACVMNADTYYFTIEALCRRSIFDRVGLVCEKMISEEILPEAGKVGNVIYSLCKGGMVKDAHSVYLLAKEKGRYPSQLSVNFLISSLCDRKKNDADFVHLALKMLDDFSEDKRKYAIKQFSCVVQALCRVSDTEGAKALLSKMIHVGPPPGNAVFNTIINGLSKSGDMKGAINITRMMEDRGLKPDVFAYSVIMSGYTKGGEMEEAAKILAEAKKNHCKLTPVTFHTMIRGYCKLEQFGKAVKLLGEMEKYGVQPNADEYNKLIQSLCLKAADWSMAEKLMENMTRKGLHLNGITKSLIRAVKELENEAMVTKEASVEA
uniref:pentatricopeptide repeat-containing protein At3g02650, mitochondrial-like n=1 Tax=Erigeron canadensis TaxID=72917 RepID=UPI001CB95655|nr:pentatricopeptide repeat-containing protein At3g02650, mitochondrial-like [Erigeron canadensis]XP_043623048.1 pentatricopeptide repeat-containing protein At3g02650, mitochondrial-like [Erigeron canadensis]XP_043623049.1 pentatricopeptide repeat-containing protein At3g02650, mitochondrial-like [Erigeron canadensis]